VVKETKEVSFDYLEKFQSPLGEVVKETIFNLDPQHDGNNSFQSPLGEVVKETLDSRSLNK
jgi:hypothetical protein